MAGSCSVSAAPAAPLPLLSQPPLPGSAALPPLPATTVPLPATTLPPLRPTEPLQPMAPGAAAASAAAGPLQQQALPLQPPAQQPQHQAVQLQQPFQLQPASAQQAQVVTSAAAAPSDGLNAAELVAALGGEAKLKELQPRSDAVRAAIERRLAKGELPWRHDIAYHHLGLDRLLQVAASSIKPAFDGLVAGLARRFDAKACLADVKPLGRSRVKTAVRYGGDAARLSDAVRGTLVFEDSALVLECMVAAVEQMLDFNELWSRRVYLTYFHDHFQGGLLEALRGNRRLDFLVLMKIDGFVCELRFTTQRLRKENRGGRSAKEEAQQHSEDLLYACMQGDQELALRALQRGAHPNGSRDLAGLGALHHAAQRGSLALVQALLNASADPLAEDGDGYAPIFRAVLLRHDDVLRALVNAMYTAPAAVEPVRHPRRLAELAATALEPGAGAALSGSLPEEPGGGPPEETGLVEAGALGGSERAGADRADVARCVVQWAHQRLPEAAGTLWHLWARMGCFLAFGRAWSCFARGDLGDEARVDARGYTPLDHAIASNCVGVARLLLEAGYRPCQPYLIEDRSPAMKVLCAEHPTAVANLQRSRQLLEGTNVLRAARDGNLAALQVLQLDGHDLSQADAQGKTAAHYAAERHHWHILELLSRDKLAGKVAGELAGLRQVVSNAFFSACAALKEDGSVIAWGQKDAGGDISKVKDALVSEVQLLVSTRDAFAALKSDGSVVTWGFEEKPGAGLEWAQRLQGGVRQLASTQRAFAALCSDGSVVAWGSSDWGGSTAEVQDGLSSDVQQIASTRGAFAALRGDGKVVAWGHECCGGDVSQVQEAISTGVRQIVATKGPWQSASSRPQARGAFAVLKADGSVCAWGSKDDGGDTSEVKEKLDYGVVQVVSTVGAFAARRIDGSVVVWGHKDDGGDDSKVRDQLTTPVRQLASTIHAFAALLRDGSVVAWGSETYGGDTSSVRERFAIGVQCIAAGASGRGFAARLSDGSIVTWGR
eukprot:TRINITY_DN4392_c1_g2_i1.p1 TRINITY_DN4392_c1_g2~~TRINITY_DN4392_c1_g2_i1.p1  ORF type:complete len:1004 (-),score=244.05 TRINITY_DN4392_c1_g2_i1:124-3135(-)